MRKSVQACLTDKIMYLMECVECQNYVYAQELVNLLFA